MQEKEEIADLKVLRKVFIAASNLVSAVRVGAVHGEIERTRFWDNLCVAVDKTSDFYRRSSGNTETLEDTTNSESSADPVIRKIKKQRIAEKPESQTEQEEIK